VTKKYVIVGLLIFCSLYNYAQNWNEVTKVVASDRAYKDEFGYSVHISGTYAIVGARIEDEDEFGLNTLNDAGSAYILERDSNGTWIEVQKIVPSDRDVGQAFGEAVGISGNIAMVGAPGNDLDASGSNYLQNAGAAYVFIRDSAGVWNEMQKVVALDRGFDDVFGSRLAISGDRAIIGAFREDEDANGGSTMSNSGSAYIFEMDSGGVWNQVQKIVAADRAIEDTYGWAVDIAGDFAIVGSRGDDEDTTGMNYMIFSGSAYIYERDSTASWNQSQKITASDREPGARFGFAVNVDENICIVGAIREGAASSVNDSLAGAAYLYQRDSLGTWIESQKLTASDRTAFDEFGSSVAIEGDWAIVGAVEEDEDNTGSNYQSDAGSAYLFKKDSIGVWNEIQKITASDRQAGDLFGNPVAISGLNIIVGVFQEEHDLNGGNPLDRAGSAYIYSKDCFVSQIFNVTACDSYLSQSGNYLWTSSGTYMDTIQGAPGCGNIPITVNLTIKNGTSDSITATACPSYLSPSGNYVWTTSGIYTDTLVNSQGCDSIITIDLSVSNSSFGFFTTTSCDSFVSPSGNYIWTNSGIYLDTISNSLGCDSIITINVNITPSPVANIGGLDSTYCSTDDPVNLTGFPAGGTFSGDVISDSLFLPSTGIGSYVVSYSFTDMMGCSDSVSQSVVVDECTTVESLASQKSIIIYPNPNHGAFSIFLNSSLAAILELDVVNYLGQIVYSERLDSSKTGPGHRCELDLGTLPNGLYLVRIASGPAVVIEQIVIE
jgi:hypothetical protein